MKRILKYKNIIGAILLIVIVIIIVKANNNVKSKVVPVKKVSAQDRVVIKSVSASGEIKSANQADLSFPSSQRIVAIYVKKGDAVKKGQLLATIESQALYDTVQAYKDARDSALRDRELFIRNKDTNKDTLGGSEQYNIKLRQYNEQVSQAEAQYNAQLASLKNTSIYSPFDANVVDVTKDVGETAIAGEVVVKVADLSKLRFEANIDQEDFAQLKKGMDAEITLDAYPNDTFKGVVSDLPLFVDSATSNSFTVKVDFTDTAGKSPLLGMTGDVKIITQTTQSAVPSLFYDEIYSDEESKPYVWVMDNGYVSKQSVEIGLEGDIYTELKTKTDKQMIAPLTSDIEIKDGYKAKIAK